EEAEMQLLHRRQPRGEGQEGALMRGKPSRRAIAPRALPDAGKSGVERAMHVRLETLEVRLGEMALFHVPSVVLTLFLDEGENVLDHLVKRGHDQRVLHREIEPVLDDRIAVAQGPSFGAQMA